MRRDVGVRHPGRASASRADAGAARLPADTGERGAVTAEAALVLPVLVVVGIGLAWLLALGVAQVRVVDGAREAARLAARGDEAGARLAARRVAPSGADLRLDTDGDRVVAVVTARFQGPGGVFSGLPAVHLDWRAEAVAEPR